MTEKNTNKEIGKEKLGEIVAAVLQMEPEERTRAARFLKMYGTGRIAFDTGANRRRICYDMETGHILICVLGPKDAAGIMAGFMEIEKRNWLNDDENK